MPLLCTEFSFKKKKLCTEFYVIVLTSQALSFSLRVVSQRTAHRLNLAATAIDE
jgi:uncharacterized membrane protein YecN with MAPEG domain